VAYKVIMIHEIVSERYDNAVFIIPSMFLHIMVITKVTILSTDFDKSYSYLNMLMTS
jgi:hypothetical protein